MSGNNIGGGGGGGYSFFESTFDYRSLLPGQHHRAPDGVVDGGGGYGYDNDVGENSDSLCYEMSLRERLLGCGTCMAAGFLLSMGSFWRISALVVRHDPFPFVVNATVVRSHSFIYLAKFCGGRVLVLGFGGLIAWFVRCVCLLVCFVRVETTYSPNRLMVSSFLNVICTCIYHTG